MENCFASPFQFPSSVYSWSCQHLICCAILSRHLFVYVSGVNMTQASVAAVLSHCALCGEQKWFCGSLYCNWCCSEENFVMTMVLANRDFIISMLSRCCCFMAIYWFKEIKQPLRCVCKHTHTHTQTCTHKHANTHRDTYTPTHTHSVVNLQLMWDSVSLKLCNWCWDI